MREQLGCLPTVTVFPRLTSRDILASPRHWRRKHVPLEAREAISIVTYFNAFYGFVFCFTNVTIDLCEFESPKISTRDIASCTASLPPHVLHFFVILFML